MRSFDWYTKPLWVQLCEFVEEMWTRGVNGSHHLKGSQEDEVLGYKL